MTYKTLLPTTASEVEEAQTIRGKRLRIDRYGYENPLVYAVLNCARAQGLSGEDTMTWLAYEALLELEKITSSYLEGAWTSLIPPAIIKRDEKL